MRPVLPSGVLRLSVLVPLLALVVACQNFTRPADVPEEPTPPIVEPAPEEIPEETPPPEDEEEVEVEVEVEEELSIIDSETTLAKRRAEVSRSYGDHALPASSLGYYLDVQFAGLQFLVQEGVEIVRLDDHIRLRIPGSRAFANDSYELTALARQTLDQLARQLLEYDQSLISINGYSNNLGDPQYNLTLSLNRAIAVGNYLAVQGVDKKRMAVRGLGASPLMENISEEFNRRIELTLWPLVNSVMAAE